MRTPTLTAPAICLCLAGLLPAAEKEEKKSDADKMQGTWQTVSVQISGVPLPDEIVNNLKYEIKGNKMITVGVPEIIQQYAEGTFKLDSSTTPKAMDFTVSGGDKKGDQLEAIYEFKGDDELRICVQIVGKERPNEFATKEGDNRGFLVLKREKK
jgi:uncharacterized protein (TIGR03067 family)